MHVSDMAMWECHQFLGRHTIGRVCVLSGEYPVALPVNYRFVTRETIAPSVLLRTRPGNLISQALGPASFEVDEIDIDNRRATSVIVRGRLCKAARWTGLPDPYPWLTDERDEWLAIEAEEISGRRFVGRSDSSADAAFDLDWEISAMTA